MFEMIWAVVVMMVGPPGEPVTSFTRPEASSRIVGAIAESIRFEGWMALSSPAQARIDWAFQVSPQIHFVVEEKPRTCHGYEASVEGVNRRRNSNRVAVFAHSDQQKRA
jgi:hypothetical protein